MSGTVNTATYLCSNVTQLSLSSETQEEIVVPFKVKAGDHVAPSFNRRPQVRFRYSVSASDVDQRAASVSH